MEAVAEPYPDNSGSEALAPTVSVVPKAAAGSRVGPIFVLSLLAVDLAVPLATAFLQPWTAPGLAALAGASVLTWRTRDLYRWRFWLSVLDDLPNLALGLIAGVGSAAALGLFRGRDVLPDLSNILPLFIVSVVAGRALVYAGERWARRRGLRAASRVLIIGSSPVGHDLESQIADHDEAGIFLVGFLGGPSGTRAANLGHVPDLGRLVTLYGISDVILAAGDGDESQLTEVLRTCRLNQVELYEIPRFLHLRRMVGPRTDQIWGIPVVRISPPRMDGLQGLAKRLFDIVVSLTCLIIFSPVMLLTALAVRIETGPGVLFRQRRVGRDGLPFTILKFRSLKPDDDSNPETTWNISSNARLGRVGRFIRRTSLDELPQFLTILKGDMSVVGPRPERPLFVRRYSEQIPHYRHRHRMPAGLTGYAQVMGLRGDTSIKERALFDNLYIENWSLWLDLKIFLRTMGSVFSGS